MHVHNKCQHELKFCRDCDAVWCARCSNEWSKKNTQTWSGGSMGGSGTVTVPGMINPNLVFSTSEGTHNFGNATPTNPTVTVYNRSDVPKPDCGNKHPDVLCKMLSCASCDLKMRFKDFDFRHEDPTNPRC